MIFIYIHVYAFYNLQYTAMKIETALYHAGGHFVKTVKTQGALLLEINERLLNVMTCEMIAYKI